MLRIDLVNNEFDSKYMDGIGRYSKIYAESLAMLGVTVNKIQVDKLLGKESINWAFRYLKYFLKSSIVCRYVLKSDSSLIHLLKPEISWAVDCDINKPIISTWHDMFYTVGHKYDPKGIKTNINVIINTQIGSYLKKKAYEYSEIIIANSTQTLSDLSEYFKQIGIYDRSKKHYVVNLGISDTYINQTLWYGDRKDFIYIGKAQYVIPLLVKIFNEISIKFPNQMLHIFTSTFNAKKTLDQEIKKFKNDTLKRNIILHFRAPDEEIIKYTKKAVALLHLYPSEGFGYTILEAASLGTPVITLEDARIPEETARVSYKISLDKVSSLAMDLIGTSSTLPIDVVKYARSFSKEKHAKRMIKIYEELL